MAIETSRPNRAADKGRRIGRALYASCSDGVLTAVAGLAVFAASSSALAANWQISPRLEVRETYTDNVFLSATAPEEDYITTVAPGVSINRQGRRFQINADYALNYLWFANTDDDDIRHNLSASFNSEAIRDLFFIEGGASVNQQFLDRTGPTSYNSANLTDNRATIQAYNLSPYFAGAIGQTMTWEVRYRFNYLVSDQGSLNNTPGFTLSDGMGHDVSARIGSGQGLGDLSWTLSGVMSRFKRESNSQDFDNDRVNLDLGYRLSSRFSLVGSVGYQKTNLQSLSRDREGLTWNAGISFAPGPRTSMTVRYGRRIDDEVFSGSLSYRVSSTSTFNISYSDDYQTSQRFISSLLDSIPSTAGDTGVPPQISSPGFTLDDRAFRSQRATAGWAFSKNKTSLSLSANYEARDYDQATSAKDKSYGASLDLSRRLSRASTISVGGNYRNESVPNSPQENHHYTVRGRFERRLSERLSAYVQVFRYERVTDVGADLEENGATISLRATF